MKFTEEKLKQAFIEILDNEGYPLHLGNKNIMSEEEFLMKMIQLKAIQ